MAPTDIPARYAFTTTYIILSRTYTYTYYDYDYPTYTYDDWYSTYTYSIPTYRYPSYYDYYDNSGTRIALGQSINQLAPSPAAPPPSCHAAYPLLFLAL